MYSADPNLLMAHNQKNDLEMKSLVHLGTQFLLIKILLKELKIHKIQSCN